MRQSKLEQQVGLVPKEVKWCKKCLISNQRPRIIFDSEGVCSGCKNNDHKNEIDLKSHLLKQQLLLPKDQV